jgi:Ca2+/Na+ antiporter
MAILGYVIGMPLIFITIVLGLTLPLIYIVHDVVRYKKLGWIRPEGFNQKKQVRHYIIMAVSYYAIAMWLHFNKHEFLLFFFIFFCFVFYVAYVAEDSDNPNKKVKETKAKITAKDEE